MDVSIVSFLSEREKIEVAEVERWLNEDLVSLDYPDGPTTCGNCSAWPRRSRTNGRNAPEIRDRICTDMEWCGLMLSPDCNRAAVGLSPGQAAKISTDESRLAAYAVAADEETWIAKETIRCLRTIYP